MMNTNFERAGDDIRCAVDVEDNRTLVAWAPSFRVSCAEFAKRLLKVKDGAFKQVGFVRLKLEPSGLFSSTSVCPF